MSDVVILAILSAAGLVLVAFINVSGLVLVALITNWLSNKRSERVRESQVAEQKIVVDKLKEVHDLTNSLATEASKAAADKRELEVRAETTAAAEKLAVTAAAESARLLIAEANDLKRSGKSSPKPKPG